MTCLRAIAVIWHRDMLRLWRDRMRFMTSLVMPLLYLVVFGTGLSASLRGGFAIPGVDYMQYIFPGVISMTLLTSGLMGAMSIVHDREFGFLKEVLVAPVPRPAVAVGKMLGGVTQAVLQGTVILLLAPWAGVALSLPAIAQLLAMMVVLAFALVSLGLLISTCMQTMQGFQGLMNLLLMPMVFLSGAMFLLDGLPGWMTVLTRLNPAAYGIDALRRAALAGAGVPDGVVDRLAMHCLGGPLPVGVEAVMLAAFGALMLGLAARRLAAL